jgi:hypothetical protein
MTLLLLAGILCLVFNVAGFRWAYMTMRWVPSWLRGGSKLSIDWRTRRAINDWANPPDPYW